MHRVDIPHRIGWNRGRIKTNHDTSEWITEYWRSLMPLKNYLTVRISLSKVLDE
jgi:hypothetical protein